MANMFPDLLANGSTYLIVKRLLIISTVLIVVACQQNSTPTNQSKAQGVNKDRFPDCVGRACEDDFDPISVGPEWGNTETIE